MILMVLGSDGFEVAEETDYFRFIVLLLFDDAIMFYIEMLLKAYNRYSKSLLSWFKSALQI